MIKWKEEYALGIPKIDEQHKKLFEIAASAETMLLLPEHMDKFDDIIAIIDELKKYVVFHFSEEQKIMEHVQYPKYFSHRIQHDDFIEKIYKIDLGKVDNNQQQYLLEILNFVVNWILEHVLVRDKEMANHYHIVIS